MALEDLARQLQAFADQAYGRPTAIRDLRAMADGHAGLTFGFHVGAEEGEDLDAPPPFDSAPRLRSGQAQDRPFDSAQDRL